MFSYEDFFFLVFFILFLFCHLRKVIKEADNKKHVCQAFYYKYYFLLDI